ncbi:MAG: DUF1801 domain-containing protein [Candidatus Dojkabacteria bacterium]
MIDKKINKKKDIIVPGGVDQYIDNQPVEVQEKLNIIRSTIREVAPGSIETVSYFQIPGYSYEGYDYNGMFTWFSFSSPNIRLHVRPPVLQNFSDEIKDYTKTKAILSFPLNEEIPVSLVKKLVKASIQEMKGKKESKQ